VNLDFIPWQSVGCVSLFNYYTKFVTITITPIVVSQCFKSSSIACPVVPLLQFAAAAMHNLPFEPL
jgi:hypothetical protein